VRHLLAQSYPLECGNGENLSTGMVIVDITERKIAEAALSLSEPRYRDVVAVLDVVMPRLGGTATADKLLVQFPD
jgi:hypothetical protein